jgi:hypothetical protein
MADIELIKAIAALNIMEPHVTSDIKSDIDDSDDSDTGIISSTKATKVSLDNTATYPRVMNLDVGGRIFKVSRDTLMESGLFRHQLSDHFRWAPEADGSYFLDADPGLFEHLLRFMRRPEVFPLFYDKAKGLDYDLYNRLEAEAEYFQIDALHAWINEKKYLEAVKVTIHVPVIEEMGAMRSDVVSLNQTFVSYVVARTRNIYICPRKIHVHRGDPSRCGMACDKARGEKDEYEAEPYLEMVSVKKEIEFVGTICRL